MTSSIPMTELSPVPHSAVSDEQSLVQAAKSDPQAFAPLYERHQTNVYRYLLSRVGNVQDAEDLTTQTFMAALKGIHHFKGESRFVSWVIGIAKRKVADYFRRFHAMLPLERAESVPDKKHSPEAATEQTLQIERVAACLQTIAPDRAEAITLRVFGGLSVAEVSKLMNRSDDAIYALVSRGLRDLRQKMNTQS